MISKCLLYAVITIESAWNPKATSPVGAKGLAQLMPVAEIEVQRQCGLPDGNMFNPIDNLLYSECLLGFYLMEAKGDLDGALILYNGGYRGYARYQAGKPLFTETAEYVVKVKKVYNRCVKLRQNSTGIILKRMQ